MQKKWKI